MHNLLLSLIIWTPIVVGLLVLILDRIHSYRDHIRWVAFVGALLSFVITLPLYTHFNTGSTSMQFIEYRPWIESLHAYYHLGIDGISMLLVMLNSMITPLVMLASWRTIQQKTAQYLASFLIMSGLINGAFMALDALLFYVFFEAMLIPLYLIIGIWGGSERIYASLKLFLYTLLGSLLMLVALIYLYQQTKSFDIIAFHALTIPLSVQLWLWVAFFFAFAVKVPMWPIHTWLPSAHVEAPTGGSIVLAAITLKIGAYGFLRFMLPIAPDACRVMAPFMIVLSLIAIIYIGFVALVQTDMKKLVAYSSISHMGLVTLGLFLFSGNNLNQWALEGALVQMVSHGFISAALFMCIGVMYDRVHSRQISDYGGVANKMPVFAAFMMLFSMANAALPGTSGFVGEFMILMGAMQTNFWIALMAGSTLILGAGYTLWMYKRVIFGEMTHQKIAHLKDIEPREFLVLLTLAVAVLMVGLCPDWVVVKIHPTIDQLIHHVAQTKF